MGCLHNMKTRHGMDGTGFFCMDGYFILLRVRDQWRDMKILETKRYDEHKVHIRSYVKAAVVWEHE